MTDKDKSLQNVNEENKSSDGNETELPVALRKIAQFTMEASSISGNPLHHKMNEEHISKVLDTSSKHDERQYDLLKRSQEFEHTEIESTRKYTFWSFLICTIILLFILVWFKDKPEILVPILTGLAGLLGGYGYGKSVSK